MGHARLSVTRQQFLFGGTSRLMGNDTSSRIKSYSALGIQMRSTKQLSITLSNEMAKVVRRKVASGEYATESEVIRDGLRALQARDKAVEQWLHSQVVPSYDAIKADPSCAVPVSKVRAALTSAHRRAKKKTSG